MATLNTKKAMKRALRQVHQLKKKVRTANYDKSEGKRKIALLHAVIDLESLPNLLEYISDRMKGNYYD